MYNILTSQELEFIDEDFGKSAVYSSPNFVITFEIIVTEIKTKEISVVQRDLIYGEMSDDKIKKGFTSVEDAEKYCRQTLDNMISLWNTPNQFFIK